MGAIFQLNMMTKIFICEVGEAYQNLSANAKELDRQSHSPLATANLGFEANGFQMPLSHKR